MEPDLWVDEHWMRDDGTIETLVEFAREGVDPQVGSTVLVGNGEDPPRAAKVIERTRDGVVVLRYEQSGNALSA